MSAAHCLFTAVSSGVLVVADALLEHVPELLDCRIKGVPEPGTNECSPLWIACTSTSTNMSGEARIMMVQLLLDRFRARAEQHGQAVIFSSIGREFPHVALEYRALQAARSNGHAAVEFLLLAAGVPSELDPTLHRVEQRRARALLEKVLEGVAMHEELDVALQRALHHLERELLAPAPLAAAPPPLSTPPPPPPASTF